jgi:glycosyltransferase involved in cell wall biosynthesis
MRYKIAYLTSKDPSDKTVSSGVYYYQSRSLGKHCGDVYHIGPVNSILISAIRRFIRIISRFSKKKHVGSHSLLVSRIYGWIFTRRLKRGDYDLVFADKASAELAYLSTDLPVIYSTDATFDLLHNYYSLFTGLSRLSVRNGNRIEKKAILNSQMIFCTSQWAASSVMLEYNCKRDRVFIHPRGANIDTVPDYEKVINKRIKAGTCRLLYMGHEWYRKGYDMAYKTMKYLRSKGVDARLIAIGVEPPDEFIDEHVELIGYINKNTREGMELFGTEMLKADFYLLPTRAECVAITFCEASAYGLPIITRDTGGVTEVVKNGINGFAMRYDAGPEEYGATILSILSSENDYQNLVKSTRKYFDERLNWDVWGKNVKKILDKKIGRLPEKIPLPREETHAKLRAAGDTGFRG